MSEAPAKHFRTPLARVRGRGAARSGTESFRLQRLTAVANIPLVVAGVVIVIMLLGRNQAAVAQRAQDFVARKRGRARRRFCRTDGGAVTFSDSGEASDDAPARLADLRRRAPVWARGA